MHIKNLILIQIPCKMWKGQENGIYTFEILKCSWTLNTIFEKIKISGECEVLLPRWWHFSKFHYLFPICSFQHFPSILTQIFHLSKICAALPMTWVWKNTGRKKTVRKTQFGKIQPTVSCPKRTLLWMLSKTWIPLELKTFWWNLCILQDLKFYILSRQCYRAI